MISGGCFGFDVSHSTGDEVLVPGTTVYVTISEPGRSGTLGVGAAARVPQAARILPLNFRCMQRRREATLLLAVPCPLEGNVVDCFCRCL